MTKSVRVPDEHQTFTYDELDRLTGAAKTFSDGYTATYTYDPIGNLLSKVEDGAPTITYNYPSGGQNRPHAVTSLSGGSTNSYSYNLNGDMNSRTENGVTYSQAWDSENRLSVVTATRTTTGDVTRFVYNGDGARVMVKNPDGSQTLYLGRLAEYTVPGYVTTGGVFTVTKTADTNDGTCNADCSLREAIVAINNPLGPNVNTIILPAGVYTLTITGANEDASATGDLDITDNMTIIGVGQPIIRGSTIGGWDDRILQINAVTVKVTGVTIQEGKLTNSHGAGVNNAGTLTLEKVTLTNNTITGQGNGGGIYNSGTLTFTNSAVLTNTAENGGGVNNAGGVITILNSTLSGNKARTDGAGLRQATGGGTTLLNVTITNNQADSATPLGGDGGGIHQSAGTLTVTTSIIAGNSDSSASGNVYPDCAGTLTSQGYNLVQSTTGCTITGITTGNITGQSANLGALANNGGPTLTHAPNTGSLALDAGASACAMTDQRAYSRMGMCDIGSYEANSAPAEPLWRVYYSNGAMRVLTSTTAAGWLYYLHADHLNSTSTTTCGNSACGVVGAVLTRQSYYPYGGVRQAGNLPTDITFTGQRSDASTGLQFFNARYYSGALGRFISADTIVPGAGNPQKLNRYTFVVNNPLKYADPTGHMEENEVDGSECGFNNLLCPQVLQQDDARDLTEWIVDAANYMAEDSAVLDILDYNYPGGDTYNPLLGVFEFCSLVCPYQRFDVKRKIIEKLGHEIMLDGHWFNPSIAGDILFGFYGASAGYELDALRRGAGAAQVAGTLGTRIGTAETYFDTPDDYYAIKLGYTLFVESYVNDNSLSVDEFSSAMDTYATPINPSHPIGPMNYRPNSTGPYPANYFDMR